MREANASRSNKKAGFYAQLRIKSGFK